MWYNMALRNCLYFNLHSPATLLGMRIQCKELWHEFYIYEAPNTDRKVMVLLHA